MRDWRLPDESSYLTFNERPILTSRHHPIVAVLPFVKLTVFAYLALLAMGLFGIIGTIVTLLILVQWSRVRGYAYGMGFGLTVAIIGGVLLYVGLLDNPETVVFAVIITMLVVSIYRGIEYFLTTVYLTDRRLFRVTGIFTRVVGTLPLRALTDIRYDQTVLGRLLDYGHFFVESAGQDQALSSVRFIRNPHYFYRMIMHEALGGELPPEFFMDDMP